MSKNLKDLIDALEEKTQAQNEQEISVRELKEENEKLKFTIKEQKLLIQELKEDSSKTSKIPEDIQLLKEVIVSQRQELNKKDKDIGILEDNLNELKNNLEYTKSSEKNHDLIKTQKLIIQLTEENELYRLNESSAKILIEELTRLNDEYKIENENLKQQLNNLRTEDLYIKPISSSQNTTESNKLIRDLKEKMSVLEEEKEKLNKLLETANITQNNLIEEINTNLNEISNLGKEINEKNVKLNVLNEKLESLSRQNISLKEQLENSKVLEKSQQLQIVNSDFQNKESKELLENLKKENRELKKTLDELNANTIKIESLKQDNINLNNVISELIQNQTQLMNYKLNEDYCFPKTYQSNLFMKLYTILENHKKDMFIQALIQDLTNTNNNDIKRSIINILTELKDIRIYDTLLKIIHENDWLVKLYILKSLNKFNKDVLKSYFTNTLEELRNDKDSDVREAAINLLNRIL